MIISVSTLAQQINPDMSVRRRTVSIDHNDHGSYLVLFQSYCVRMKVIVTLPPVLLQYGYHRHRIYRSRPSSPGIQKYSANIPRNGPLLSSEQDL